MSMESQDKFVAKRGKTYLNREELEVHLASVIRLENIGVLLGAGASISAGGKTMGDVWKSFKDDYSDSADWLQKKTFFNDDSINVEELLDTLEIAEKEWIRQGKTKLTKQLQKAKADLYRSIIKASVLQDKWWNSPHLVDLDDGKLDSHRALLQALCGSRQVGQPAPWIFTTNYDLAMEWAGETLGWKINNGFEGLHNRIFSPHVFDLGYSNLSARGEARFGTYGFFLAKLHGSLSWQELDGEYLEYPAATIWSDIQNFLDKKDNHKLPIVFPSAAKYIQTVGFVLGELLRRFTEFLSKSQTCLITIGYSFSDSHLNQIVKRALLNPTLQLVICLPELEKFDGNNININKSIQSILKLESPQITIIGGKEKAFFDSFVTYLPQPVIYDEYALKIKKLINENKEQNTPAREDIGIGENM
ncbi:SIR2 family anti-phage-associated protein [Legionella pneumophila serogroup 1]